MVFKNLILSRCVRKRDVSSHVSTRLTKQHQVYHGSFASSLTGQTGMGVLAEGLHSCVVFNVVPDAVIRLSSRSLLKPRSSRAINFIFRSRLRSLALDFCYRVARCRGRSLCHRHGIVVVSVRYSAVALSALDPLICDKKSGSSESCSRTVETILESLTTLSDVSHLSTRIACFSSLVDIEGFPASNLPMRRRHCLECFSHLKLGLVKKKGEPSQS